MIISFAITRDETSEEISRRFAHRNDAPVLKAS